MATDAAAIRQLSDLARSSGIIRQGGDENHQPNLPQNDANIRGLCELDQVVSSIEQKVVALREIVSFS